MAQPTTPHPQPPPIMPPTPGMAATPGSITTHTTVTRGAMPPPAGPMQPAPSGLVGGKPPPGPVAQTPDTPPADPVLFDDIDPVLLVRLYPKAASGDAARAEAEKAGKAAHDAGMTLVAAQQEPVAPESTAG